MGKQITMTLEEFRRDMTAAMRLPGTGGIDWVSVVDAEGKPYWGFGCPSSPESEDYARGLRDGIAQERARVVELRDKLKSMCEAERDDKQWNGLEDAFQLLDDYLAEHEEKP